MTPIDAFYLLVVWPAFLAIALVVAKLTGGIVTELILRARGE